MKTFCCTGQRRSLHCATATDVTKEKSALFHGATAPTSVHLSANTEQLLFNITYHMCIGIPLRWASAGTAAAATGLIALPEPS